MTPTGEQLYNSLEFWNKRFLQQYIYSRSICHRFASGSIRANRFHELMESANDVSRIINKRIKELRNAGTKR